MCRGDVTQLVCGHTLQHITRCQLSETYTRCVITWEHRTLRDNCAPCDPKIRRRQLRDQYEVQHGAITDQMLAAKREGDEAAIARLSGLAARLLACHQERMREVLELERKVGLVVSE